MWPRETIVPRALSHRLPDAKAPPGDFRPLPGWKPTAKGLPAFCGGRLRSHPRDKTRKNRGPSIAVHRVSVDRRRLSATCREKRGCRRDKACERPTKTPHRSARSKNSPQPAQHLPHETQHSAAPTDDRAAHRSGKVPMGGQTGAQSGGREGSGHGKREVAMNEAEGNEAGRRTPIYIRRVAMAIQGVCGSKAAHGSQPVAGASAVNRAIPVAPRFPHDESGGTCRQAARP